MRDNIQNPPAQSGAVLVVAMIFLIVMTLLAVTGMSTTSMEERMASNSQESMKAFQAAETGLAQALDDANTYDLTGTYSVPVSFVADTCDADPNSPFCIQTNYGTGFLGVSKLPLVLNDRGLLFGVDSAEIANFDIQSKGQTTSGISSVVNGGAYHVKGTSI